MNRARFNISLNRAEFNATRQVTVDCIIQGQHWIMHEHDDDINDPSCPHCHAKERNWKLDIYTGYIYEYPRKRYKSKASKQEMKHLWQQKGFMELVIKERNLYYENYHFVDPSRYPELPPLPVTIKKRKPSIRITSKWIKANIRKKC